MAVLKILKADGQWREAGRTEVVSNNESPVFIKVCNVLLASLSIPSHFQRSTLAA